MPGTLPGAGRRVANRRSLAVVDTGGGFDRDAAQRVIARAAELDRSTSSSEPYDHVLAAALVEAAEEVGLDPELVRLAGAEEQVGLLGREPALLDRMVGPAELVARATMHGSVAEVFAALDDWMLRKGGVRRTSVDPSSPSPTVARAGYRRRGDALAGAQRAVRSAAGRAQLGSLRQVELRVAALDDHRCLVVAVADVGAERTAVITGASGVSIGGSAISAGVALAGTEVLWLGVPGSLAAGAAVLLIRGHTVTGLQHRLDAALGRAVEASDGPSRRLPSFSDLRAARRRSSGR